MAIHRDDTTWDKMVAVTRDLPTTNSKTSPAPETTNLQAENNSFFLCDDGPNPSTAAEYVAEIARRREKGQPAFALSRSP
jgi:hypothetical protein